MGTYTIDATKSAIIKLNTPDTHVTLTSTVKLDISAMNALLCEFDISSVPSGQLIKSVKAKVYLDSITNSSGGSSKGYISYKIGATDFNASTVTWNSAYPWNQPYNRMYDTYYDSTKTGSYLSLGTTSFNTKMYFVLWNYYDSTNFSQPTINTTAAESNKPQIVVTTEDSVPTATDLHPINTYADGAKVTRLSWTYSNEAGGAQKSFQIQKSQDNTTWSDVATVTSADAFYDLPEDTFSAGDWYWRVKVTSYWDIVSEWSAGAKLVVVSMPNAPYITSATTAPRPVVAWQAVGQQAYQITAGTYDSGTMYGTDKTYTIPIYLPDGATAIKVRIQNSFGLWSPWAEVSVTVTHSGVATVTLSAAQSNAEVSLSWTGNHSIYYIYRDDALIAKTTAKSYTDRLANGAHSYTVRGATGDDYDLSAAVQVTAVCTTAMMADIDNISWVYLRGRRAAKPSLAASVSQQVIYQHYSGRTLPVADISEHVDEAYTFEYSVLTVAEANAVRALLGKVVIFKTPRDCIIGVLESMPYERDRWSTDFTFTIRAIDYREAVEYV